MTGRFAGITKLAFVVAAAALTGCAAGERQDRVVVTLDAEGRTFINDSHVDIALLDTEFRETLERRDLRLVYVRADDMVTLGEVVKLIARLKNAGAETVGFAYVSPEKRR